MSLKSAGPELGVSYTYLSKIENGYVTPSVQVIQRLAAFYGVEADALYAAAGRVPPDVERIVLANLNEAASMLRKRFGSDGPAR